MVLHKKELGKGDSILFRNRQSHVRVYMDEVLIFDSGEAFDSPFSMGYGSLWKSLPLGDDYDGKTLTIELQPGYKMQAVSGYLAKNLTLTDEAAGRACIDASVQLLRKICALALDPSVDDARALDEVRALCTQAQRFFREQGM